MRVPDDNGYFGSFGGKFIPETLVYAINELEKKFKTVMKDKIFRKLLLYYYRYYAGRPTPLYFAKEISRELNLRVYLKREDLAYTGAHKINNTIGQSLLAKMLGKRRVIAETGAGQHGIATAVTCALFKLKCIIYMGEEDMKRQEINLYRMKLCDAEVIPVRSGTRTLKDAINEALRDWVTNVKDTYYLLGSVVGPHPYPLIVRTFQSIIGEETKKQILKFERRFPDYLIACVGGGSNAIGLFYPFFNNKSVEFIGIEAGGKGLKTNKHSASLTKGSVGILHGAKTFLLQDKFGQIRDTHSIAPGLDYPGVGPEHSYYKEIKRARYYAVTDDDAVDAFHWMSKLEGIQPALEPVHAIAWLRKNYKKLKKDSVVVVCLSGRGDKDTEIVRKYA